MRKRENQILEKDYERYFLQLPWSVFIKGKTNKYIYSELEKKHPCFSDEWCFEKKISLKQKKIESDVVVVNKFKLAEYKHRFPGKKLWLENSNGRYFSSKNTSLEIFIIILSILFVVLFCLTKKAVFSSTKIDKEESTVVFENKANRVDSVSKFLDLVEKNNGRFSFLKWSSDGYSEIFNSDLKYIFPEQLDNDIIGKNIQKGNVQYKDNQPFMMVTVKDVFNHYRDGDFAYQNVSSILPEKNKINRSEIRNIFKTFNIEIKEEKIYQLDFTFNCSNYQEFNNENFLNAVNDFARKNNLCITRLELNRIENKTGADGFSGNISFDERQSYGNGINLEALAWRTNLIFEKRKIPLVSGFYKESISFENKNSTKGILIGEILKDDGTKIRFYKNSAGKVIKEEIKK